jgi:subtilisin
MSNDSFVVTYAQPVVEIDDAAKILSVAKTKIKDGVEAMIAEVAPAEDETLHFREIGASVCVMSEADAEKMRQHEDVLEVVPDFEVFALGESGYSPYCDPDPNPDAWSEPEYADAYLRMLQEYGGYADWCAANFTPFPPMGPLPPQPWPPWPFPPFPPLPRPPFPWPPRPPRPWPPKGPIPTPVPPRQPIPWNIAMVEAHRVWQRVTGRGVKVAIIDTGIDNNHPDLSVSGGASFVPGVGSWDDDQGHGTHCAGIAGARNNAAGIVGVAPECSLYAVKVLNAQGSGQLSWILAGMNWCLANGIDVASMSLGSDVSQPDAPCTVAYQRAAERLINAGCIVIAAAGNAGREPNHWVGRPARCPGFMAVAAVDRNRQRASFSSFGPPSLGSQEGVEIAAPGARINSTVPGGGYGVKSGTSMACPHVSGAAALLKEQHPAWSPAQIRARLRATADDLGAPGNDPHFGSGLLNCHRAVFG